MPYTFATHTIYASLLNNCCIAETSEEVIRYLRGDSEKTYSAKCAFTLVMLHLPAYTDLPSTEGKNILHAADPKLSKNIRGGQGRSLFTYLNLL